MDIQLNLDPAKIEAELIKAIVATSFGKKLEEAVNKTLESMGRGEWYRDALQKIVEEKMREIIMVTLHTQFDDTIRAKIAAHITPEVLDSTVSKVADTVLTKMSQRDW